jgi:hypothetical protein
MLSVRVLVAGQGWRSGRVVGTGAVAIDQTGEVVPVAKVRAIVHHPRGGQAPPAHEAPTDPVEIGYLVLLGTILFEGKRAELEAAAWPEWKARNGTLRAVATPSGVSAIVTATNGSLALAATAASGG